jgi:leucyl aminopeptidase
MNVAGSTYSTESAAKVRADVVVLPVFEGPEPGPGVKEVGLETAFRDARLKGKKGEVLLFPQRGRDGFEAGAVMLVGVGDKKSFGVTQLRRSLGRAAPAAARFGSVATTFPQAISGKAAGEAVQAAVEGLALGSYRFDRYKTKKDDAPVGISKITVLGGAKSDAKSAKAAVARGDIIAESVKWARDLVNTPAGDLPPAALAKEAQQMARSVGLTCKVWSEPELRKGGFGGVLGVGQGSVNPPRLIEMTYTGAGKQQPYALTGKGVSFDSGGLSIKDAKGMESMKDDMGGAASILATMRAIALLKPKVNVIAAVPSSENMPSGSATKPGDVLRHRGGKTSEVLNTDAEGRLILADALAYLTEKKPRAIIDTATLTGACMIALGDDIAGALGNDDDLVGDVIAAGTAVGEAIWQLPLWRDYRTLIDSSVADVKNIGERYGGAITAALFLSEFVGDVPWVHLDIAGPAFNSNGSDLGPKGATGVPVRTLVRYLLDRATTR